MNELKQRIAELSEQIDVLGDELSQLKTQYASETSPFKIGDVITWGKYKGRVTDIYLGGGGGHFRWRVQRILKNGSNGSTAVVYGFHKPKLAQP